MLEIKSDIKEGFAEVKGEIKRLDERINGLDKRLSNEEVISRSAFITVIGGVAAGLVKLFFFQIVFNLS